MFLWYLPYSVLQYQNSLEGLKIVFDVTKNCIPLELARKSHQREVGVCLGFPSCSLTFLLVV